MKQAEKNSSAPKKKITVREAAMSFALKMSQISDREGFSFEDLVSHVVSAGFQISSERAMEKSAAKVAEISGSIIGLPTPNDVGGVACEALIAIWNAAEGKPWVGVSATLPAKTFMPHDVIMTVSDMRNLSSFNLVDGTMRNICMTEVGVRFCKQYFNYRQQFEAVTDSSSERTIVESKVDHVSTPKELILNGTDAIAMIDDFFK